MCMMMAGFAVGALQAVMSYQAQKQQADQQNEYYRQNAEQANAALRSEYAASQNQRLGDRAQADQQLEETDIAAMKARGTARASADQAGVTGLSVDSLVNDFYAQQGRRDQSIDQNYQTASDDIRGQMDSQYAQGQQRISSVRRVAPPSFATALIGIASAGVRALTPSSYGGGMGGYGASPVGGMDFTG